MPSVPPPRGPRHHLPLTWIIRQPRTSALALPEDTSFHGGGLSKCKSNHIRRLLRTLRCLFCKARRCPSAAYLFRPSPDLPSPGSCTSHTCFPCPQAAQLVPASGPLQLLPPPGALLFLPMDALFSICRFQLQGTFSEISSLIMSPPPSHPSLHPILFSSLHLPLTKILWYLVCLTHRAPQCLEQCRAQDRDVIRAC